MESIDGQVANYLTCELIKAFICFYCNSWMQCDITAFSLRPVLNQCIIHHFPQKTIKSVMSCLQPEGYYFMILAGLMQSDVATAPI